MRQQVVPGGHIDAATTREVKELLDARTRQTVLERIRASEVFTTDGNGDGSVIVYRVPTGMEFRLGRVVVEANGFSYPAMFTNAAGGVTLQRGERTLDGFNLAAGIPNAWSASSGASPRFLNGEFVALTIVGGPADTQVSVSVEGDQYPDRPEGAA